MARAGSFWAPPSNVHFARKSNMLPTGTISHEWFMGIAAITNDYVHANGSSLQLWIACFGHELLEIVLADAFSTTSFLETFGKPICLIPGPAGSGSKTSPLTYVDAF
ncbi:hypothetical protein F5Y10DRAFT_254332 [Nemania abortiva]|nr:hypothetical protein F5Y10DRAFT_254332 [Nemania abortiva]